MKRDYHKSILAFIIFAGIFGKVAMANCHFIRLNGYQMTQRMDILNWGEISPLISLEAGDYFHLAPSGKNTIDTYEYNAKNLQGELYYIPQNLIDTNNQFSLKMMVLERDIDSPDDLVLPLSERSISLTPESLISNNLRFDVSFQPFGDPTATIPQNKQSYKFEILRNSHDCSPDTIEGRANDLHFRLQNKLKQLHLHIKYYEEAFLKGGQEYKYYRVPMIQEPSLSNALNISETIATINSSELISLGITLQKLHNVENFQNVWKDYFSLVERLLVQKITIQYIKENKWKKMKVPSLSFHSEWKKLTGNTGISLPENWNIQIQK